MTENQLKTGDQVRLRTDRLREGVIVGGPNQYPGGTSYLVFFGPKDTQNVNARALEPVEPDAEITHVDRAGFLTALLLAKLDNPLGDLLYSYQASRTQFEPYQFKPVFKYLDAPVPGILIADEVGLGKTIEAAILYQELKARQSINRVLVVCPAGLRDKWRLELLSRFDESFDIVRSADVLADLLAYRETEGFAPLHAIVGLETIRMQKIQDAMDENPVRFDLVIIDEAHHLRNTETLSNRIAERLSDMTDHLILLTATPLQTGQQDLFNLVRLLDDTQFPNLDDFLAQLMPNARLNAAIRALRMLPPDTVSAAAQLESIRSLPAGSQVTAHPNYLPALRQARAGDLSRPRIMALQRDIDRMNVMSPIYTRTRKRDVTGIAQREAHVIDVPITEAERGFYEAVLAHARAQARAHSRSGWIPGFAGMMRERQAASCIAATREYLVEQLRTRAADLEVEESSDEVMPESATEVHEEDTQSVLERLIAAAEQVGTTDSKFGLFEQALNEAIAQSPSSKIIVFSYFRRTLRYLERRLRDAGINVLQINGSVPTGERTLIIDRFKTDPHVRVLLTSEVGSEGLDFQFCDTLFNYDLPWNPMRVEQRIGRIDRYGQKAEKIRIYSFFLRGTIEERILERLYTRIGIFEDSVGDLEPILGPLAQQLSREIFSMDLTPVQELEKTEQLLASLEVRRLEEEDLQKRTAELLGQDALALQAVQDTVSSGRYISAPELRSVVATFLAKASVFAELEDHAGDGTVLIKTDAALVGLLSDHALRAGDNRPVVTAFLQKANSSGRIPATFDGNTAALNRRLELLNLGHPLVRASVAHARMNPRTHIPLVDLGIAQMPTIDGAPPEIPPGVYWFVVQVFDIRSAQPQMRLETFVFDGAGERVVALESRLLRVIQDESTDHEESHWTEHERSQVERLATSAASTVADTIEAEVIERNDATIAVRTATLRRTYLGKIAKRRAQIERATNDRIIRMWRSEVRRAEAELERKLADLEATRQVAVTFKPVGYGRLHLYQHDQPTPVPSEDPQPPWTDPTTPIPGYPEPPVNDQPWT